jgi:hypothetical protein
VDPDPAPDPEHCLKKYEKIIFGILKVSEDPHPNPEPHSDPLVRGMDPRIRISIWMRTVPKCHGFGTL